MNPDSSGRHPPAWPPGPHECGVDPAWIDYNGHLRDGYYAVIASASIDALMDDLGIDESYRRATHCTLYTLELHLRFLREIKGGERLRIDRYPAEFDAKRLRLLIVMRTAGTGEIAAVVDIMLMPGVSRGIDRHRCGDAQRRRALERCAPAVPTTVRRGHSCMGYDGHFASLFPGSPGLAAALNLANTTNVVEGIAPTEPRARLSLTLPTLLDTDLLALHVTGESKLATLQRASCPGSAIEMPVRALLEQRRVRLEIYHAP